MAMAAATRQVASSCASVIELWLRRRELLVLDADRDGNDRLSAAVAIAHHLQLEVSDGDIAEIVSSLDEGGDILHPSDAAAWWDGLDPASVRSRAAP